MRVLGPSDLGGRLDALHAEPGFAAEALELDTLGERDAPGGRARGRGQAGDPHRRELRDPGRARRRRARASCTAGTAAVRRTSPRSCGPATRSCRRSSFGPGPGAAGGDPPGRAGRRAARGGAPVPARALLTHLQMGHDPDATVEACRDGLRGPGGRWSGRGPASRSEPDMERPGCGRIRTPAVSPLGDSDALSAAVRQATARRAARGRSRRSPGAGARAGLCPVRSRP